MKLKIKHACMDYEQPIEIVMKKTGKKEKLESFIRFTNTGQEVQESKLRNEFKDKLEITND